MSLVQVTTVLGSAFKDVLSFLGLGDKKIENKKREQLMRYLMMAVSAFIAAGLFYVAYRWYVVSREQTVQRIFSEQVAGFNKARNPEQLEAVAAEFKASRDQYSGSHLTPYFTAYEVDALLKLDKKEEALAALDELIASLSSSNPLLSMYKTKRALLKFDSEDTNTQEAGLSELQQLAQDKKNNNRDYAQFYLGLYYYVADNMDEAKKVWQELIEQSVDAQNSSPWAEQAKQRLESIA